MVMVECALLLPQLRQLLTAGRRCVVGTAHWAPSRSIVGVGEAAPAHEAMTVAARCRPTSNFKLTKPSHRKGHGEASPFAIAALPPPI